MSRYLIEKKNHHFQQNRRERIRYNVDNVLRAFLGGVEDYIEILY